MHYIQITFLCFLALLSDVIVAQERPYVTSLLEMRQDKVVMQQWDLSCGAAALTTLLKYQHGIDTTEKTVANGLIRRKEYLKNPDLLKLRQGFSLLDLKRYTKQIGLIGKGYGKLSLKDLIEMAPILVPIKSRGYNHFVIFRGKLGGRVLLADPAWGNRTLMVDAFNKAWLTFSGFGHVGFTVTRHDSKLVPNALKVSPSDFVLLH